MERVYRYILVLVMLLTSLTMMKVYGQGSQNTPLAVTDTTGTLQFPFDDQGQFDYPDEVEQGGLYLNMPPNIERKVEYDPETQQYIIYERIGNSYYRLPKTMSLKEYVKYDFDQAIREYWRTRTEAESIESEQGGLIPQLRIESEAFSNIFGSEVIDIRPQGYVEVQFGVESNYLDDPNLHERLKRVTTFDFENQINISVSGKIGDKVDLDFNYNTEATFDFENKMNLEYSGKEDEIIRRIEAGNVSLPLNGSLIQGGTNLFGIKTEMQFGRLNLTTVLSQHKGESQVIETEGGAQKTNFEIPASDYDENRHFFISKFFRDQYNDALSTLPVISSQAVVNRIEVWITNKNQNFNSARDIVALVDLGEAAGNLTNSVPEFAASGDPYPANSANGMYQALINNYAGVREADQVNQTLAPLKSYGFENGKDWEKVGQARKLAETEYTFNPQLGFISLNASLNTDEVLAVAYEYTVGGEVYQVGEFTTNNIESEKALLVKLIKGTNLSPELPTWDLMMKNVYNLGAYDLAAADFDFQVVYKNDSTNTYINYLPEGDLKDTILLQLMNLDNLNSQKDYGPDGVFDFVQGITVIQRSGRIIFPVLEPFGSNIADNLSNPDLVEKYAYSSLYAESKTKAEQDLSHNKFAMVGSYKGSSGSEIALNAFNLAPGSVKVSAGGVTLIEDQDYVVDYALGRVKIINDAYLEAGTPIQVSTESQELISTQRKTLLGTYASYYVSDKLNIGGTMMYMNERPITNKVEMGEEPVSNMMLGLDFQYRDRSKLLTDVVNLLPFYESDVESSISIEGEVAKLITGNSKSTGNQIYIDDFEGVETSYSFTNYYGWELASTPQGQPSVFPEAELDNNLLYGANRARLAWYSVDRTVFNDPSSSSMPSYMKANPDYRSNHYTRTVLVNEIYPGKELALGMSNYLYTFDLAFYPREKGPYNFDAAPAPGYTAGVDQDNKLREPTSRWAGVMRDIKTPNFEASNVEFIEFWVLDPYIYDDGTHEGGDLYFNLGNVSEDILKDSRKAFENGLPVGDPVNIDTTVWGRVSTKTQLGVGFDNEANSRSYQDLGLDGLSDEDEASFFNEYIGKLQSILSPSALDKVMNDPANDNFHYYRGPDYDEQQLTVLERYKLYNSPDGNSPTQDMTDLPYSPVGKDRPDIEDINEDNTLNELEAYYQYRVSLRPEDLVVGQNFVVDKVARQVKLPNEQLETVNWYQFKIPVTDSSAYERIGEIHDFKSIRFMRMYLTNFSDSVVLRFGTLNLVRSDWRKVIHTMVEPGATESSDVKFDVTSINIEENGNRTPINYILPPDIDREVDPSNPTPIDMNEQSMLLKVQNLEAGDARAVYKKVGVDLRQFKRIQMDVHAEKLGNEVLNDNELSLIMRMGTDADNYYEYEIPLKLTPEPATSYNNESAADRLIVWPKENRLLVELDRFSQVKMNRNAEIRRAGSTLSQRDAYEEIDTESLGGKNIFRVVGNPSLGEVDVVYVGVRNPERNKLGPRSVEVWVNELRVSDLDSRGGWASSGRMALRLADLGSVSLAGRTQSVGWGSINQVAAQRSLENRYQFDMAATAELGKLVPEQIGLRLPFFYSYSQQVSNPEYSPLSTDIKMKDALDEVESPEEKEEILSAAQDVVVRKSLNFNNVMLEPQRKKTDRTPLPIDIENFSVSYAKNEQVAHNIDIEKQLQKTEKGVFNYNYSTRSTPIRPFKSVDFLKPNAFALIRDFNFSVLPEMISFRTDLTRNYNERTARDNSGLNLEMPTTVQKDFLWNRYFDFRYNLSQSLSLDFSNKNISRIDELAGVMDRETNPDEYDLMMQEIYNNLASFGRPVDYTHTLTVNYRLPINKLPLLDWTSASVNYKGAYDWMAGPQLAQSGDNPVELGNSAGNNMNLRANGQLNFQTLYNKVPYLKSVNSRFQSYGRTYGSRSRQQQDQQAAEAKSEAVKRIKEVKYREKNMSFRADVPKSIFHRLETNKVKVVVLNERGDTVNGEVTVVDINRVNFKPAVAVRNGTVLITGEREITELFLEKALAYTTRMLMGVRSVRVTYNKTGATELPGFLPEPYLFGMRNDETTGNNLAPTIPFLLGWQNDRFALEAASNGWITTDNSIQKQYRLQSSETWNFSVQLEPIPNVQIDLTGNRRESNNNSSFINYNEEELLFELLNGKESGNFDMTILTLKTLFDDKLSGDEKQSTTFNQFRYENLQVIANRLNSQRGWVEDVGYSKRPGETVQGVSLASTDVIIPAFVAAYTGMDPTRVPLTARPGLQWIRPNWRVNYNGNPQQIDWMKNVVHSLNFSHSYKSTYSIGQFETNLGYRPDQDGLSWTRDELDGTTFIPELAITSVNIQESFNPLINVDIGFVNDLSTRFEIRKTRNLNFDFTANQLNEMIKDEYSVGLGYRFTGLDMIIKTRKKSETVSNDINMRFDVTSSNYKNVLRKIDVEDGELNGGTKVLSLDFQADYMVSDKLNVKLYYQYNMSSPHNTINGHMRSNTKFGLSFNFSIM
ncbi:T9SS outer membrane translocon Sov/SprA [Roseimarinus sediminis]|uniref:T9SS outer membrane translocon Sov/SprA n=1 Tax=Roseimarinus sediminis TaxID=1610899 RepID=UPI003D219A3D